MKEAINAWLGNQNVYAGNDEQLSPGDTELIRLIDDCMADIGPKWIPVGDALPEEGQCVDSWVEISGGDHNGDTGRIENVFYDHGQDFWWHHNENDEQPVLMGVCVTHWIPLPKAPD